MLVVLGEKAVSLWDTNTRTELPPLNETRYGTVSIALSRNGTMATGYHDGELKLWDVETREALSSVQDLL